MSRMIPNIFRPVQPPSQWGRGRPHPWETLRPLESFDFIPPPPPWKIDNSGCRKTKKSVVNSRIYKKIRLWRYLFSIHTFNIAWSVSAFYAQQEHSLI